MDIRLLISKLINHGNNNRKQHNPFLKQINSKLKLGTKYAKNNNITFSKFKQEIKK